MSEIYSARDLYARHPEWPVIDITGKAIEETAADILRIYHQRAGTPARPRLAADANRISE